MEITQTIQNQFLETLSLYETKVSIYLKSGTRLEGYIQAFDKNSILLKGTQPFLIQKQCICSILPATNHELRQS